MKKFTSLALASTLFMSVIGCDGGGVEEGVPKDVDMTKSYSPAIPVGPISAKDIAKGKAKDAAAGAGADAGAAGKADAAAPK